MIADARRAGLPDRIEADLVIIGSGAAGLTLALELEASGLDVVLLEAGGERFDRTEQDLYRAEAVSPDTHGPVDMFRRRVLGGSTSVWGGRCIPFDPIDFEERPWLGAARWPLTHDEVARHYPRALEIAQAGRAEFTAEVALPSEPAALAPGVTSEDVILDRLERFSHPTNFGAWYRERLAAMPRLRLFTNAPVEQILTADGGARAAGVRIRADGRAVTVAAPRVVVAAGGIETARLLLASTEARACGLGNEHDLVGRYYQCHIEGEIGHIAFLRDLERVRMDYQRSHDGVYVRRFLWLSPEAQRRHRLAGLVLRPAHASIVDPDHRNPVLSAMYLVKNFIVPEYARKMTSLEQVARRERGGSPLAYHAAHLRNIVVGSPRLLAFATDWTRRRVLATRKLPSVVLQDRRAIYPIDVNAEQAPHRDSRVMLGEERDAIGMPRVRIDWRMEEADVERLIEGVRVIQRALAPSGTTRIDLGDEDVARFRERRVPVGGHHIGTARMAEDASQGVCDRNGQVFGTAGLFLAGAATFPTSGFANPTLTLMALTIRLAGHLARRS